MGIQLLTTVNADRHPDSQRNTELSREREGPPYRELVVFQPTPSPGRHPRSQKGWYHTLARATTGQLFTGDDPQTTIPSTRREINCVNCSRIGASVIRCSTGW